MHRFAIKVPVAPMWCFEESGRIIKENRYIKYKQINGSKAEGERKKKEITKQQKTMEGKERNK